VERGKEMSAGVAAVIPTYNRSSLVLDCIGAILAQTHLVRTIYVIDGGSNDGTGDALMMRGLIAGMARGPNQPATSVSAVPARNGSVDLVYINLGKNLGSMGGFAEGMKRAYDADHDWVWIVDDDAVPSETCLENLLTESGNGDLLGPIALTAPGSNELSVSLWDRAANRSIETLEEALASNKNGTISQTICPMHGCLLISRAVQDAIGNISPETFHWGGEVEYALRAKAHGFRVLTVVNAVNYHQKYKVQTAVTRRGRQIELPPGKLQSYCYHRNNAFIAWRYGGRKAFNRRFWDYAWYFLNPKRADVRGFALFVRASVAGVAGAWGGEARYLARQS
jgi:rhamnopyranosyl-N-acetylglucosaminyl-diphospho-decaprenol beta-1,3/1,4-galactofuranosyltransferase